MKPDGTLLRIAIAASCAVAMLTQPLRASIAYGSINNFDTVNDTGHECHGFEIEIEDCRSTDISYTYDYNHYGTSKIIQDDSIPGHPKCVIRWASKKNPDGSWASYTAIPSGPINPTDGHRFTNPAVNVAVGAVRYNWLVDDGAGNLISGGQVQVSTPVYSYYPPVNGGVPQVQAVIAPPPPEVPEPKEFGNAVWVKEIRTTSHNNKEVKLRDLVSDDPDDGDDKNWKNGEPDEVETEWQILQKDTGKADGGPNNEVPAAAEDLPGGDEVVTRRYEFYKYIGPIDDESGEAIGSKVGPDDIHGFGIKIVNGVEVDLSTVEVVGEFTGSQMAAVDVDAPVGLIDHVSEASVDEPFAARSVVVPGAFPFICIRDGVLPAGMSFDEVTGVLSGTPEQSGEFNFRITASDVVNPEVSKSYTLLVAEAGAALPPSSIVDTVSSPVEAGTTTGDGAFDPGSQVTVTAAPLAGFRFLNWTDNGKVVSTTTSHTFIIDVNHSLVANFSADLPQWTIATSGAPVAGGTTSGGGLVDDGASATVSATANAGYSFVNWTENSVQVSTSASYAFTATVNRTLVANFTQVPTHVITAGANPAEGGSTTGAGAYSSGSSATVTATANEGYVFTRWTVAGNPVSTLPGYTFTVTADRSLVANFVIAGTQQTISTSASPQAWGNTSGGGSYASGDSATVVATPNSGYAFSRWQEGNSTVSTSVSYTFTVAASRTLTAKFIEAFVITANVSPAVGGTTEMDSTSYKSGENAKASATPANGFSFSNWSEDGVIVSTDPDYRFDVTGNRTLVANFTSNSGFTINTNPAPAAGGTTTGDGAYPAGDTVMVSAVPNEGYGFVNWTQGAAVVSTESDYSFTADASRQLVAHFAASVAITASASPAEGGIVSGAGSYPVGAAVSLTATANYGYAFNGWAEGSTAIDAGTAYGFNVTAARALVANFIAVPQVTVATGAPGSHTMDITWPAAALGWVLEESADLIDWTPSALPVTTTGDTNKVSVATSGPGRYFRLSHP
jgi:hypothetical protein